MPCSAPSIFLPLYFTRPCCIVHGQALPHTLAPHLGFTGLSTATKGQPASSHSYTPMEDLPSATSSVAAFKHEDCHLGTFLLNTRKLTGLSPDQLPVVSLEAIGNISKKRFFSGRKEPPCGRIACALGIQSSRISRAFFAFHFWRLVHPDASLSLHLVRRACCGPTPSSCLPIVSAPLCSRLLASCLLLAVARIRRPSLLPSHLWRPRSVRFHRLLSAAILRRFFLSLHPTVTSIIPILFTRRPAQPPGQPPTLGGFPSHRGAKFRINDSQNSAGRVEAGHFLWESLA